MRGLFLAVFRVLENEDSKSLLHTFRIVAHSVAQIADKPAQIAPKRCSTVCPKLLICFKWEYYLANFKTAGFNHSPTPPLLILAYSAPWNSICDTRDVEFAFAS